MNYDSVTDAGRGIVRKNRQIFGGRRGERKTAAHVVSFAARWLTSLTAMLAVAWVVAFVVPTFSGMLAATVIGLGIVWLVPLAVVTGIVRVLETSG